MQKVLFALVACLALLARPSAAHCNYFVEEGDSISSIAENYEVTEEDILALNPEITNPDLIYAGQVISLPCDGEADTEGDSITDLLAHNADLSILSKAVAAAGLWETLSDPKLKATVFAPDDDAFIALLSTLNLNITDVLGQPALLTEVLSYHLVPDMVLSAKKLSGMNNEKLDTALPGAQLKVKVADDGVIRLGTVSAQFVRVTKADLKAGKAVVHIVRNVLLPFENEEDSAAPTPAPKPAPEKPSDDKCTHVVVEGDTLFDLAAKFDTTLEAIVKLNPEIKNPDLLSIGTEVKVC